MQGPGVCVGSKVKVSRFRGYGLGFKALVGGFGVPCFGSKLQILNPSEQTWDCTGGSIIIEALLGGSHSLGLRVWSIGFN